MIRFAHPGRVFSLALLTLFSSAFSVADTGMSPSELYRLGFHDTHGAFSVYDVNHCSFPAALRIAGSHFHLSNEYVDAGPTGPRYVRDHADIIAALINEAFVALDINGDPQVREHHVCVGMFDYGQQINMKSYSEGYILLDPNFLRYIWTLPIASSMEFVVYHEFAHQLQYWYNVDYRGARNSRLKELTADCVGAALEALSRIRFGNPMGMDEGTRLVAGAAQLGDFGFDTPDFHGTPVNRARSAAEGVRIVGGQLAAFGTVVGTTGRFLIEKCDQFIKGRDAVYGENWPNVSN